MAFDKDAFLESALPNKRYQVPGFGDFMIRPLPLETVTGFDGLSEHEKIIRAIIAQVVDETGKPIWSKSDAPKLRVMGMRLNPIMEAIADFNIRDAGPASDHQTPETDDEIEARAAALAVTAAGGW